MPAYTVREVIEMLKLSEVCQTVGVTRRTLQAYAKIGLLEPTKKTIGGYWYNDDDAVATLQHRFP